MVLIQKFNKSFSKLDKWFEVNFVTYKWLFITFFSILLIAFNWVLIVRISQTTTGDFDYFAQAYEAVRKTILEYRQFPWVNSWVGGGVPLYANPQIGVFSPQTILVLFFNTVVGLKLSLLFYSLVGFWSFYALSRTNLKASSLSSICLSLIWATNGFFMTHYIGHYTFALFQVFPLLCYLVLNITKQRYWIYLAACISLLILSALHYAAVQSLLMLTIIATINIIKNKTNRRILFTLYMKSLVVILVICLHRIVYTLNYLYDFPRIISDAPNKVSVLLKAFIIPSNQSKWYYDVFQRPVGADILLPYSWGEFNAFVGYAFVAVFILTVALVFYNIRKRKINNNILLLLLLPVVLFIVAIGDFSSFSPYAILHKLPGFSGMRIPSRWLVWVIFFGLAFVGYCIQRLPSATTKNVIKFMLIVSAVEVATVGLPLRNNFNINVDKYRSNYANFEQFDNYDHFNKPLDLKSYKQRTNLDRKYESYGLESTRNNLGEARGYEPLVDTRFDSTLRCGIVKECNFILSKNADILKWSPNEIILKRIDNKPVILNMNASDYWLINGQRIFASSKVVDVNRPFVITNTSEILTIKASPKSIVQLAEGKLMNNLTKMKRFIRYHFL